MAQLLLARRAEVDMVRRVFVLLIALLILPASAHAAVTKKKAIWGPAEVEGTSQFPVYKSLGAGIYQTTIEWDQIAVFQPEAAKDPEDPGYDWPDSIDSTVYDARKSKIQVALTVTGTPSWAKKSTDLAGFLAAAAKRYRGVHIWSIGDGKLKHASAYPRMLDAAYAALKKVSKKNQVIGGFGHKVKLSKHKQARMDFFGYNPSGRRAPTAAKLAKVERQAAPHKLWLGPVSLPTSAGGDFRLTKAAQASWLKSAFKLVRKDKKIATLSYSKLQDELGAPFTGLIDADGKKKPAYNAFKRG
jgi:hypothetical protein